MRRRTPQQLLAEYHETVVLKLVGGRKTPRSGAGRVKGDIITDTLMVECKATQTTASVRVAHELLFAVYREASRQGRIPVLSVMCASGDPTLPTSLQTDWLYFLWPVSSRSNRVKTDAVYLQRSMRTPVLYMIADAPPGYPQSWRLGCIEHLQKEKLFFPSMKSSNDNTRLTLPRSSQRKTS